MRPHHVLRSIVPVAFAAPILAFVACVPDYAFLDAGADAGAPVEGGVEGGATEDHHASEPDGAVEADAPDAAEPLGPKTLAMGYGETCALHAGGWWCWGAHTKNGNLGFAVDGGGSLNTPTAVSFAWGAAPPDDLGLAQYDFGGDWTFSCARHAGAAYCYGDNEWTQLAHNRPTGPDMSIVIESFNGSYDDVAAIAIGGTHSCGITTKPPAGAPTNVFCWGFNDAGRTGRIHDPQDPMRAYPIETFGATFDAIAIAAGSEHTCVIADDHRSVYCWGVSTWGQAGAPQAQCPGAHLARTDPCNAGAVSIPLSLAPGEVARQLVLGDLHTCLLTDRRVLCWGDDSTGQLGHLAPLVPCSDAGTDDCSTTPLAADVLTGVPKALAAGRMHTCALMNDGSVVCWGSKDHGERGTGGATDVQPVRDRTSGAVMKFVEIAAGGYTTCARDQAGDVWCWGDGPLGSAVTGDAAKWPSKVAFP